MPAKPLEENLGKLPQSVSCSTDILNVVFSEDWKYVSRNPVSCVSKEESWWRSWWAAWGLWPRWKHGAARQGYHEGKRVSCVGTRLVCSHHPSALHQLVYNLSEISRKLHQGVGFAKVTPASGAAEQRSRRKTGPSWPLDAVCWPAAGTVQAKMSTGVHMQSDLINSAAHKATCLVNSDLCLWTQWVRCIFYLCFTWCGSQASSSEAIIPPFPY